MTSFWVFVWALVAFAGPLVLHPEFRMVEDLLSDRPVPVQWWVAVATLVPAARYARGAGRGFAVSAAGGTAFGVLFLGLAFVAYRWGIPMRQPIGAEVLVGLPFAVAGAVCGAARPAVGAEWEAHTRLAGGAVIAVLGALILPSVIQRGADFSVADPAAFPSAWSADRDGQPATVTLPAAGTYGVYAIGSSPRKPVCRVGDAGDVHLIGIDAGTYGVDGTPASRWIGEVSVPAAGAYTLVCQAGGGGSDRVYDLGPRPAISGAVGTLIRWPVAVFWVIGSLPGLLMVARSRARAAVADVDHPAGQ